MRGLLILDFGSQYTQAIARRLRDLGFYSEIVSYKIEIDQIKAKNPFGIILSGGPMSVYEAGAPLRDTKELEKISPILGSRSVVPAPRVRKKNSSLEKAVSKIKKRAKRLDESRRCGHKNSRSISNFSRN